MAKKPETEPAGSSSAGRKLDPAAARALAEARERRKARHGDDAASGEEVGGRGGLDPARYGDWEKDGIVSDF